MARSSKFPKTRLRFRKWSSAVLIAQEATIRHWTMAHLQLHSHQVMDTQRVTSFDTDSSTIGIDNRCSTFMSNRKEDFGDDLKEVGYQC